MRWFWIHGFQKFQLQCFSVDLVLSEIAWLVGRKLSYTCMKFQCILRKYFGKNVRMAVKEEFGRMVPLIMQLLNNNCEVSIQ